VLTVVCWKWGPPAWGYRSKYSPKVVHRLRDMVARHYHRPHRFLCVTDDPTGLEVETFPLWPEAHHIYPVEGKNWPSCYVRLRAFSAEAREWFGDRYCSIDLDTVITGDLTPLLDRTEDLVVWNETDWPKTQHYNCSIWLHSPGTRTQVWESFDPATSPQLAYDAGCRGGDQAWLSYCLGPGEAVFTPADGVLSYRRHIERSYGARLPARTRMVNFHGVIDPWSPAAQRLPWVREHWGMV